MTKMISSAPRQWAVMLECGHEATTYCKPDPSIDWYCQPCVDATRRKREAENKEIDDALRGVAQELRRRGINAEYWHSGGGCMVVRCETAPQFEWVFGLEDVCWGGDFSSDNAGHLFSVESSYPVHTKYETVADWIWSLLSLPPFVDMNSGIHIENPYYDTTKRQSVDPWGFYGLPYPPGTMISPHSIDWEGCRRCDNCTETFFPQPGDILCARCRQPDPRNQH